MAAHDARALVGIWCALHACFMVARATPDVTFPFNSQVPTVARVDQRYSYQLSDSTFAQSPETLVYSLQNQPAWLTFDGATRTFEGTPGQADVGSVAFILTAADSTGAVHTPCTLVVSSDPAPFLAGDISEQLAATANLSSSEPVVVTILPSTVFKFDFDPGSFIDIVQRKLYYYATLTDHTPLPSWLVFDSDHLTFSGTAPNLSAFPQSWSINMIASDVTGFAGTSASFTIAIAREQLAFVPEQRDISIKPGESVTISSLKGTLYRDNLLLAPEALANAIASLPSWLDFNVATLDIEGKAPANVTAQNLTVMVTDEIGNSATAVINLIIGNVSYFDGQVGTIVARAGELLSFHFEDSLFSQHDLELSLPLPSSTNWLRFDADTRDLVGFVPSSARDAEVKATLLAKPGASKDVQAQVFTIDIQASSTPLRSTAVTRSMSRAPATGSPTSSPSAMAVSSKSTPRLATGPIVAIVVLTVAIAALLTIAAVFCCRRRRIRKREQLISQKSTISRPMPSPELEETAVMASAHHDVEKHAGADASAVLPPSESDHPPQIAALKLPSQDANRMSRWSNRFSRHSLASSIGTGEDMIRADSNIPVWGRPSIAMSAPHDSFLIPAKIAKTSRQLSDTSPSKLALSRLHDRNSAGNGIGISKRRTAAGRLVRHSSSRRDTKQQVHMSILGLSTTREASSISSFTTRGTSVLSTQTTLPSEFPRPPSTTVSLPTLSVLEGGKRKSYRRSGIRNSTIRMVARSDSVKDDRSLDEKRQSFIRKRASKSGVQSPLFAHGSRGSSSANAKLNSRASTNFSATESMRASQQPLTTCSESSSWEPRHVDSKRFSQKVRSVFAPNFPRALTKSTLFQDEDRIPEGASSSGFHTTSESVNSDDWIRDLPKPRNERNFVLPGEASPTPPPAQLSIQARGNEDAPVQAWKKCISERASSPLSAHVDISVMDRSSPLGPRNQRRRKCRLGEPESLDSANNMHESARARLACTNVQHPISVNDVQKRTSSVRANHERAAQTQARAGSEQWEETDSEDELNGAALMPVNPAGVN